jgi:predicted nucleic-acid-binding Zn-ribbon protein
MNEKTCPWCGAENPDGNIVTTFDGEIDSYDDFASFQAQPTGVIWIECHDCGLNRRYTKSTAPAWAADIVAGRLDWELAK